MANAVYTKGKEYILTSGLTGASLKLALVDSAQYTVNLSTHQYLSDVPSAARLSTTAALTGVTFVGGKLDSDDVSLPDAGGGTGEALVLYVDTGVEATSALIAYYDSGTGLPLTQDSVADTVQAPTAGWFQI